jgi:hypothetical protein
MLGRSPIRPSRTGAPGFQQFEPVAEPIGGERAGLRFAARGHRELGMVDSAHWHPLCVPCSVTTR